MIRTLLGGYEAPIDQDGKTGTDKWCQDPIAGAMYGHGLHESLAIVAEQTLRGHAAIGVGRAGHCRCGDRRRMEPRFHRRDQVQLPDAAMKLPDAQGNEGRDQGDPDRGKDRRHQRRAAGPPACDAGIRHYMPPPNWAAMSGIMLVFM